MQDRMSVYEQYNYSLSDALKNEYDHGIQSLNEIKSGLERFKSGEGRHGSFNN